ncbi:small subunit processome component 20 homolog [Sycon ciliatum]|uniref:small subunit processome component 20 homolog n=1 Tax=Sycon ciliatum TaxID=27933 RepID=UPI0031F68384
MKRTPQKLKKKDEDKNRFRFQSFNDRVAEINIGVARRFGEVQELDEDADTYFQQGLEKWRELNCTAHFTAACRDLPQTKSLPQVIHHQEGIVAALKKHLAIPNSLALQPLLDLVLQLARDLHSNFYSYFEDFFDVFVALLSTNNSETIEQVFTTLAYLIKFLRHSLLQHITTVYNYYKVLLSDTQKPYITSFAVESFSFLVRKLRKPKRFVVHVANSLEDDEFCQGVGLLLFESVKGVCMQFHSSTEVLLSAWLPHLGLPSSGTTNPDMVLEAMLRCMQEMAEYTRKEHCAFIWPLLLEYVDRVLQKYLKSSSNTTDTDDNVATMLWAHLERVLRLVQKWVTWRQGTRLENAEPVYQCLHKLLESADVACESYAVNGLLIDLVRCARPFQPALAQPVADKVLASSSCRQALEFAYHLASLGSNGQEVLANLPRIVENYASSSANYSDVLVFLSSLSQTFQDNCTSPDDQLTFDLSSMPNIAEMLLKTCQPPQDPDDGGDSVVQAQCMWNAATALRICQSFPDGYGAVGNLRSWLSLLSERVEQLAESGKPVNMQCGESSLLSFNVLRLTEVLLSLDGAALFVEKFTLGWALGLLKVLPSDFHMLKMVLTLVNVIDESRDPTSEFSGNIQRLSTEDLVQVFPILQPNLSHPFQPVRQCTLEILSRFPQPMSTAAVSEGDGPAVFPVIRQCLDAQEVTPSLQGSREKIRLLDQLKCTPQKLEGCPEIYREVALRYLIGCFYVNFRPVWSAATELITSYATNTFRKTFWTVYNEHLELCTVRCRDLAELESTPKEADQEASVATALADSPSAVFCRALGRASISGEDARIDHLQVRLLLWQTMSSFPSSSEASTRYLIPIFLSYVREEYSCLDDAVLKHQDLRHRDHRTAIAATPLDNSMDEKTDGADENNEVEQQHGGNTSEEPGKKGNRRMLFKTLSTMLTLFSKFIDPRSVHREADMKQLMLQLLCHREEDIQILALQYLMAYKPQFLLPYKENLFNLLKEANFRDTLTHFTIDEESGVVKANHRSELMPYLIRVLYGRMLKGTGASTTGKEGINRRRGVVLRFLSGCPSDEVKVFVDLISAPFQALFDGDRASEDPLPKLDLAHAVPLRKQQGFLTMVGQVLTHLRSVITPFLPSLLHTILCVTSWVGKLLRLCHAQAAPGSAVPAEDMVDIRMLSLLRTLRQLGLARLTELFDAFPTFDFEPFMKNILEVAVWPQLGALPTECLQHPTPLMKLMLGWSQRKCFLNYFAKPTPESMDNAMLHYVFACLRSSAVRPPVVHAIMQLVDNLLNNGNDQRDAGSSSASLEPSAKRRMVATSAETTSSQRTDISHERGNVAACAGGVPVLQHASTTGEQLLLPHLPLILEHLGSLVVTGNSASGDASASSKKPAQKKVPLQYLTTLSRMSEFVESPSLSEKLVKAFLPLVSKSLVHGDALSNVLLTISRLLQRVTDVEQFVVPLSKLFTSVKVRSARQHLCTALQVVGSKCPQYEKTASIVQLLNAWDPKRLEEPDVERRLDGFKLSVEVLESSSEPDVILALIYNALFTIHQDDETALRDSACYTILALIKKLAIVLADTEGDKHAVWSKNILAMVFLPALQQGVRSKSDAVRHEFVALLSEAVRSLSVVCPRLANLQCLHNDDLDVDFFENVRHVQVFHRTNAFRWLATKLDEGAVPPTTIASFILPLASHYLTVSGSDHNLVTQAVAVLAALAKQSPWARYKSLLQRYLRLLLKGSDQQKIHIRVVVSILESFHFDVKSIDPALYTETDPTTASTTSTAQAGKSEVVQGEERMEVVEKSSMPGSGEPSTEQDKSVDDDEATTDTTDVAEDDKEDIDDMKAAEVDDDDEDSSRIQAVGENMVDEAVLLQRKNDLARRIFSSLRRDIIPELDNILARKAGSGAGGSHHLSNQESNNADLIVCMPIALAAVKLFQKLPEEIMHMRLPGLLLKVCNVLRSRSKEVRDTAKQSLVKISCSLGPRYLSWVIKELRGALTRGYQLHVLGHALHAVLEAMADSISPGEVDDSIVSVMQVVSEDLFGEVASERQVGKIADKVPEARSTRSRLIVQLLARFVGSDEIQSLLQPMRDVLRTSQSLKAVHCIEECLRHISLGLLSNTGLETPGLLVMIHSLCVENNSGLGMVAGKNESSTFLPEPKEEQRPTRPELYSELLLPAAPVRGGKAPGMSKLTNMHVLLEFALQLLLSCFKRASINTGDKEVLQMLDPLCSLLAKFLTTQHVKLLSLSLRVLVHLLPLSLPRMERFLKPINKQLFRVLREYSAAGAAVGNNHEMIVAATKALATIIYNTRKLNNTQLQILMNFVDEDINDSSRKGTAFPLLKAILSRKFEAAIIHEVMKKVRELIVAADIETVQLNCRQAMMQYLLDYPLGKKKISEHVMFFLANLKYEMESGRVAVLEMLNLIATKFPTAVLTDNADVFFVTVSTRMVSDDSALCRKLAALAIQSLIEKVNSKRKDSLFSAIETMLANPSSELPLQRMCFHAAGVFVTAEGALFERRLAKFLPLLQQALTAQDGDDDMDGCKEISDGVVEGTDRDEVIFTALCCLTKIVTKSQLLSSDKHMEAMNSIWGALQELLLHPHDWVRLYACQLYGYLFTEWPAEKLLAGDCSAALGPRQKRRHASLEQRYLLSNAHVTVSQLARCFIWQLTSDNLKEDLSRQIIKNLVYIAKALCLLTSADSNAAAETQREDDNDKDDEAESSDEEADNDKDDDGDSMMSEDQMKTVDIAWMIKKMVRISKYEAGHHREQSLKRSWVIRWLAALTHILQQHGGLDIHLASMLSPVLVLVHDKNKLAGAELYTLAESVLQEMRTKSGHETFSTASMQAERAIREKRDKRRQQRLLENVANPARAAQRKIKLNAAKKEAKKRKLKEERIAAKTLRRKKKYKK